MTVQLWCLFVGCLLPYVWAGASVPFRNKQLGGLDLAQPRLQASDLTAGGAGAWGAQMNAWEALGIFTASNVAAYMAGVEPAGTWATLAIVWAVVIYAGMLLAGFSRKRVRAGVLVALVGTFMVFSAGSNSAMALDFDARIVVLDPAGANNQINTAVEARGILNGTITDVILADRPIDP